MSLRYLSFRHRLNRAFKKLRQKIERFSPSPFRKFLLKRIKPTEQKLAGIASFWIRHGVKLVISITCLLLLNLFYAHIQRDLDPYVTYEKTSDGRWRVYEEYRVVESNYVYSSVEVPECRDKPSVKDDATALAKFAEAVPDFSAALSPLRALEISQAFVSYYIHGQLGRMVAFDGGKRDVASCRTVSAWLPLNAKPTADILSSIKIYSTTSRPSTVNCTSYSWHELDVGMRDQRCGYQYIETPKQRFSDGRYGVEAEYRNWLQDRGVHRCVQISIPFIPGDNWSPPKPTGRASHSFDPDDSWNLLVVIG